jgi:hypothetical protein
MVWCSLSLLLVLFLFFLLDVPGIGPVWRVAWCPSSSFFQFIIMWFLCGCSSSNSNIFDCCNQDALLQKLLNDNYLSEEERYVE